MKTLYKCDYCEDTFSDPDECKIHEKECHYNLDMKACETCNHHDTELAGTGKLWNTCDKNLLTSNKWIENYAIHCHGWENGWEKINLSDI